MAKTISAATVKAIQPAIVMPLERYSTVSQRTQLATAPCANSSRVCSVAQCGQAISDGETSVDKLGFRVRGPVLFRLGCGGFGKGQNHFALLVQIDFPVPAADQTAHQQFFGPDRQDTRLHSST